MSDITSTLHGLLGVVAVSFIHFCFDTQYSAVGSKVVAERFSDAGRSLESASLSNLVGFLSFSTKSTADFSSPPLNPCDVPVI